MDPRLQRLDNLEAEARALRAILEAEKKSEWQSPVFVPLQYSTYYYLYHDGAGAGNLAVDYWHNAIAGHKHPKFRTEKAAEAFADAFNVMLELRACEGVVPINKDAYAINCNWSEYGYTEPYVSEYDFGELSPFFTTEAHAEAALAKVTPERFLRACKTLALVEV